MITNNAAAAEKVLMPFSILEKRNYYRNTYKSMLEIHYSEEQQLEIISFQLIITF